MHMHRGGGKTWWQSTRAQGLTDYSAANLTDPTTNETLPAMLTMSAKWDVPNRNATSSCDGTETLTASRCRGIGTTNVGTS